MRRAWISWADGRPDSPISANSNGVIELAIDSEMVGVRLEPPDPWVGTRYGPSRSKTIEHFPFGTYNPTGPPPRVLLQVSDNEPAPPEPAKPKRKASTQKGAA